MVEVSDCIGLFFRGRVMKREKVLKKVFGEDEFGFPDLPKKISGTKISRVILGDESGCSFCFPHGIETKNGRRSCRYSKCWKRNRKTQYK